MVMLINKNYLAEKARGKCGWRRNRHSRRHSCVETGRALSQTAPV
jgi:hypothetical protein